MSARDVAMAEASVLARSLVVGSLAAFAMHVLTGWPAWGPRTVALSTAVFLAGAHVVWLYVRWSDSTTALSIENAYDR